MNSEKGNLMKFAIAVNIPNFFSCLIILLHLITPPLSTQRGHLHFPNPSHTQLILQTGYDYLTTKEVFECCDRGSTASGRPSVVVSLRLAPLQWNTITSHAQCFGRVASSWHKHVQCSIVLPAWVVDNAHYYRRRPSSASSRVEVTPFSGTETINWPFLVKVRTFSTKLMSFQGYYLWQEILGAPKFKNRSGILEIVLRISGMPDAWPKAQFQCRDET